MQVRTLKRRKPRCLEISSWAGSSIILSLLTVDPFKRASCPFTIYIYLHLSIPNCIPNSLSALRLLAIVLQYHYSYYCRKTGAILVTLRHLKEFHQWAQKLREKNGRAKLYTMGHRMSSEYALGASLKWTGGRRA